MISVNPTSKQHIWQVAHDAFMIGITGNDMPDVYSTDSFKAEGRWGASIYNTTARVFWKYGLWMQGKNVPFGINLGTMRLGDVEYAGNPYQAEVGITQAIISVVLGTLAYKHLLVPAVNKFYYALRRI